MRAGWLIGALAMLALGGASIAAEAEKAVERHYAKAPAAPRNQTAEQAKAKSAGCVTCHSPFDALTMHRTPAVVLGCTDCHGGDASATVKEQAHVLPRYPESWHYPSAANPKQSYTLLNREAPEFVRFANPSDYRVARESCGACHMPLIEAAERSLMATGAMFYGGAAYNNGIVKDKVPFLGEAYTREGEPAKIVSPGNPPGTVTEAE